MRTFDSSNDELHLKSINARKILKNTMLDFTDLISRDALLYFLRIAILICGYIVVRPLIEACFRRVMTSQETVDERENANHKKQKQTQKPKPRQKSLAEELLVDSDEAEDMPDDEDTSDRHEWGGTLRRRQKARFMEVWEEEQARLAEEEELRELEDILED